MNILFVCLGNICRSPAAHAVFLQQIKQHNLSSCLQVDSAGTGNWHIGEPPDKRAIKAGAQYGYDLSPLRARQISTEDFYQFDLILAMDKQNLSDLQPLKPVDSQANIELFLNYSKRPEQEVPDPYYGDAEGFTQMFELIIEACEHIIAKQKTQN